MKKSEGKGTIDEVDWNGWLVTNWNSICKKFVFFVRPETFGLKSGLSHNGTCTPRRLLCAPHSQSPSPHLKRRGT